MQLASLVPELRKEYDAKIRQKSEAEDVKSTPDVLTGNNTLLNFNSDLKESKKEPTSPPLLDVKKAAEPQAELRNKDEVLRRPSGDESGGHGEHGGGRGGRGVRRGRGGRGGRGEMGGRLLREQSGRELSKANKTVCSAKNRTRKVEQPE